MKLVQAVFLTVVALHGIEAKKKKGKGTKGASSGVIELWQGDFEDGTVILSEPGVYRLMEDISFQPVGTLTASDPEDWMMPNQTIPPFNLPGYRLGFFAAIAITGEDITLDLNDHTLEQSEEHALFQRFYANIELASSPFPPNVGPANFGGQSTFSAAKNVQIKDGVIGRSSHHGIHGNLNEGVELKNLEITDFEVAGVSLNFVKDLKMKDVKVHQTRTDVPANGALSQSIFLLQAVDNFLSTNTLSSQVSALKAAVYNFLSTGTDTNGLFGSEVGGIPDASLVAGVVIHGRFSVGDFEKGLPGDGFEGAENVQMRNVLIENLAVSGKEIGAVVLRNASQAEISPGYGAAHAADIVAGVFDIDRVYNGGSYEANPLADLQLAVAQYAIDCLSDGNLACSQGSEGALLGRNGIPQSLIDWSKGEATWEDILADYKVVGNHDVMFHFSKGIVGLKLDGMQDVKVKNVKISGIENRAGSSRRSPLAMAEDPDYIYHGFMLRGLSVAGSVDVQGKNFVFEQLDSTAALPVCVDLINEFEAVDLKEVMHSS